MNEPALENVTFQIQVCTAAVKQIETRWAVSGGALMCWAVLIMPSYISMKLMQNCTSCKMEHYHILRSLFVRGLTTFFLIDGLGVEDIEIGFSVIFFFGR